ncbi:MAG: DUF3341 domain-containing protein [Candidatus Kapaibacterium sp.]
MKKRLPIYGLMAEFHSPEALVEAASRARDAGYRCMDAYSPFPVEPLDDIIEKRGPYLPLLVLIGGAVGAIAGYALQYYVSVIYYPLNVGGRPYNSWPSFIPITFETMILFASLTAVFGMLGLNRLPQPYHPVFNVRRFAMASNDRFFLCIEAVDPKFNTGETHKFLEGLGSDFVSVVQH